MAAPSGTSWGSVVTGSNSGQKGKIGIYVKTSSTNTAVKTTVRSGLKNKGPLLLSRLSYPKGRLQIAAVLFGPEALHKAPFSTIINKIIIFSDIKYDIIFILELV